MRVVRAMPCDAVLTSTCMSQAASQSITDEPSPAFLRAVSDLGQSRRVVTSQAVYNAQGLKLLEGGVAVDQGLYDRLISHRLARPLDECVDAEPRVDGVALREAALAAIGRVPFFARLAPEGRIRDMLLEAIASVPLPRPIALHLMLARDTRPALFAHSILAALLAAHLAREEGAALHELQVAAAAGLLHDMGMMHVDPGLLDSDERLIGDQLNPVYVHPLTTSMLLGRFAEYSKEMVRAIVEHHERLDGSGYPRGLVGDAISPLGRVLSLTEVVTAMFDGERNLPEQRVSLLLRIDPRRYDSALVPSIHRLLRAAPAPAADAAEPSAQSIARLSKLADALAAWRVASTALAEAVVPGSAQASLVRSLDAQNASLQRMLYEAGVTPDQLASLGEGVDEDAAVRVELWALAEELGWQLHAAANQLRRRWQAADATLAHPGPLAAWLGEVGSLGRAAARPAGAVPAG